MQVETQNSTVPKLRFKEFEDDLTIKPINSILSIGSGKDYKHLDSGKIPVYGTGGLMTMVNKFLHEGESVCIGRKGTINKPIYLNEKFWTVDTLFYTHSFNAVEPKYIFYKFLNINWYKYNEASGVPSLSKATIEKINLNLPTLPEQEKIASFLSAVDERIQKLERKKSLLAAYKKGVMRQLFSQELRFKDENGNHFPDWEEKTLGDVGVFTSGTAFSNSEQGGNTGVSFLKVSDMNLTGNEFRITKANNYVNKEQIDRLKYKITISPSIIFAKVGAAIFLERKRIASNFLIDNNMMSFTPSGDIIFFKNLFDRIRLSKFAQVGALPSYNASDLKTIKLNLPCLNEQQKIASFLSGIDKKIELVETQIQQSKTFKKGLLQQMFVAA